jgi:excisionase family DNA binding protein
MVSDSSPSAPQPLPLLLRPSEAATYLAVSPRLLWSLSAAGQIPSIKLGRARRYRRADLERWAADLAARKAR